MADYIVKDTELTSVANAIRTAGGTNSLLSFPNGFVSAVNNISGGGGSSDFSTATLTINNSGGYSINLYAPCIRREQYSAGGFPEMTDSNDITVILYKGLSLLDVDNLNNRTITISGDIEQVEAGLYSITGDCTITIS